MVDFLFQMEPLSKGKDFYVVDQDESGIKISSGGEDVSLSKPDKTVY